MSGEPREEPRYYAKLITEFTAPGAGGPCGLRAEINVPNPADAPRALRAVADRLELNRLTLEA